MRISLPIPMLHAKRASPSCPLDQAIRAALEIRDLKTRRFDLALRLLIIGLTLYVSSIAILLLTSVTSLPK